jgi:acyl dehydratase
VIQMTAGDTFIANVEPVSQDQMNTWGKLLGTNGQIHTDPEFAKTTALKGVVVQGMLVLAPLHELMCQLFGAERWLRHGQVETKIVSYTRPGEATRFEIKVDEIDAHQAKLTFSCTKDVDTKVVVGSASVLLDAD